MLKRHNKWLIQSLGGYPSYAILALGLCLLIYAQQRQQGSQTQASASTLPHLNQPITCQLKSVVDGDTINIHCQNQSYRLRLQDIDAPELAQAPWGGQAKIYVQQQLEQARRNQQPLTVLFSGKDQYQRALGEAFINDQSLSLALLEQGLAVVYSQYHPQKTYRNAMHKAKSQGLGIWQQPVLQQNPRHYRQLVKPKK